jgi:serine/threonine protein kinase
VRKGDNHVMLLSHGSYYANMADQRELYGDDAAFVAPEVLNGGSVDDRCDIYSIGKFMEALFSHASIPVEYKRVVSKAVSEAPEDRYNHVEDMLHDVRRRHGLLSTAIALAAAVGIGLICLFLYFDSIPDTQNVEFVKPAPRLSTDDLIEDGFDPSELGVGPVDSIAEEDVEMRISQAAKAEEIFRKNYEKEADRILSRIYNKEYMSNSEKLFTSQSQSTIKELMDIQQQMGEDAGLAPERSQLIASEIIDRITAKKKKEMGGTNSRGIQK